MGNAPLFIIAIILSAAIIVAYVEGEAAAVKRTDEPLTYWGLMSLGIGGLGALLVLAVVE
jgi:hypothetical protein